jgi:HTH-type transcriptional regulator/antitoxin HigA
MTATANPPTFSELVAQFEPRPIRSERELKKAHKTIERLMAKGDLSKDESDYLETLSILVETFEATAYPLNERSQRDMLAHLMEVRGLTQAQLSRGTGISPATISSVLAERRQFSKADIRNLCKFLHVPAAIWL